MENIQGTEMLSWKEVLLGLAKLPFFLMFGIIDELRLYLPFKKERYDAEILEKSTHQRIMPDLNNEPCYACSDFEFTEHYFKVQVGDEDTEIIVSKSVFNDNIVGDKIKVDFFHGLTGLKVISI
ncbi:hypothetical protein HN784_01795 [bacterium]|jgi:hypothetical protein|nr:hypothetical protein [bacterium]MBT4251254.1 hypothetical protein [bacterium]MBT4598365.1 hypothetical protein [bacterium]MBT6754198.1 hypothetical protein [bacterium]MBT7038031.1 hypothetical protein [bacterium]